MREEPEETSTCRRKAFVSKIRQKSIMKEDGKKGKRKKKGKKELCPSTERCASGQALAQVTQHRYGLRSHRSYVQTAKRDTE